ncbi:MAG: hypothetical protein HY814_15490 [Candidatus Riflebacteria bacterium]|nr:hypothetical protein [Candidatus Riflebacteria bacterium]
MKLQHWVRNCLVPLVVVLVLPAAGCHVGGGGETFDTSPFLTPQVTTPTSSGKPASTISGQATKGPLLAGSEVRAYRIAGSSRGGLLGTTSVVASGAFTVPVTDTTYSGTVLLEASGTFQDEATGLVQSTGALPLRGVAFGLVAGQGLGSVQVTALTELAVALAVARGGLTDANLQVALAEVGARFGVTAPGLTSPAALDVAAAGVSSASLRYGLVLAALSGEALNKGVPVLSLLGAARTDASDGQLDGLLGSATIPMGTVLGQPVFYNPDSLGTGLSAGLDTFLRSPANRSGLTSTDLLVAPLVTTLSTVNHAPTAAVAVTPTTAVTGVPFQLDGRGSTDPDGDTLTYLWSVSIGGVPVHVAAPTSGRALFVSSLAGTATIRLTVTDPRSASGSATAQVFVTDLPPAARASRLALETPLAPATVTAGTTFTVTVPVTNAGGSEARRLQMTLGLGDARFTVVPRVSNPTTVAATSQTAFVFDVGTTTRTPTGPVSASVALTALDSLTGQSLSFSRTYALPTSVSLPLPVEGNRPTLSTPVAAVPSIAPGGTTTVTMDVTNPGPEAAVITGARLTFDGPGVAWSFAADSPREVSPTKTQRLSFIVRVDSDAVAGAHGFEARVFAVGATSGLPLADAAPVRGNLTVGTQSTLSVTSLVLSTTTVSAGTPINAVVSLEVQGTAAVQVTSAAVSAGGVVFPPQVPAGPVLLNPGAVLDFSVNLDTTRLTADTPFTVLAVADARDLTGRVVTVRQLAVPKVILVQVPASISLTSFTPAQKTLSQGQVVRVQMVVANTGSAEARDLAGSLSFSNAGGDLASRFPYTQVAGQPTRIAGHSSATLLFDVSTPTDVLGDVTVTGRATARDVNSLAVLTAMPATLAWTLQVGSALSMVGTLSLPPKASLGQIVTATFQIANTGGATAAVDSVGLSFSPANGLAIAARANPTQLAGGVTATFSFDVIISANASPTGTRVADILLFANDVNSLAPRTVSVANAARLLLQRPANIVVVSILGPRGANVGQLDNPVSMRLRNDGEALAIVQAVTLTPAQPNFNPRRNGWTVPVTLPGGVEVHLPFLLDVPATATPGRVTLSGTVQSVDDNSGASQTSVDDGKGFLLVQRRASLVAGSVTLSAPTGVDRNSSTQVRLLVANGTAESAPLRLTAAPLTLAAAGLDVTGEYFIVPPIDLFSRVISGGTTETFTFRVDPGAGARKLATIVLTAVVTAKDQNDDTVSTAQNTATWIVRDAANGVLGQALFSSNLANQGGSAGPKTMRQPAGVASNGVRLAVADFGNNRVLLYGTALDSEAAAALGQSSLFSAAELPPTSETLKHPSSVCFLDQRVFVADTDNNRVLVYFGLDGLLTASGRPADRVLGQAGFSAGLSNRTTVPNAPAARDTLNKPVDVAVSGTVLAVADRDNNRVLIWRNATALANGQTADVVLGQADFVSNLSNRGGTCTGATLSAPSSVVMTTNRLIVADTGNHRVLIWNDLTGLFDGRAADLVLGQSDAVSNQPDRGLGFANQGGLKSPSSVRMMGTRLMVSDELNSRVVIFSNFATVVTGTLPDDLLGQEFFHQTGPNRAVTPPVDAFSLASPARGEALTPGVFFIADKDNHRVLRIPLP